jgi:hypothetical protein
MRLSALGWHFRRLALTSVYHYGHNAPPFRLLLARWRSKYVFGQGELLRAKFGTGQWGRSLKSSRLYFAVLVWWAALLILSGGALFSGDAVPWIVAFLAVLAAPAALQWLKKRDLAMAIYSMSLLNFHAAGMIAGLLRPRVDPTNRIDSVLLHSAHDAGRDP